MPRLKDNRHSVVVSLWTHRMANKILLLLYVSENLGAGLMKQQMGTQERRLQVSKE